MTTPTIPLLVQGNLSIEQFASAGESLYSKLGPVYNSLKSGSANPGDLAGLLQNGISLSGITANDVSSALGSAAKIMAQAGVGGDVPAVLMSTASGIASGFAMGGPIGAAIGGVAGAAEAAAALFTPQEHWPTPSNGALINLARLQAWTGTHGTGLGGEPPGYNLYEYIATVAPLGAKPICAEWIFGMTPGDCAGIEYLGGKSPGSIQKMNAELTNTLPGTNVQLKDWTAMIVARCPGRIYWDTETNNKGPISSVIGRINPGIGVGPISYILQYGYIYALGTCFAMLAWNASDQAIAAELLIQRHLLDTFGSAQEAATLDPLIKFFQSRLSKAPKIAPLPVSHPAPTVHSVQQEKAKVMKWSKDKTIGSLGVLIGGGIGFLVAGPVGAAVGAGLGGGAWYAEEEQRKKKIAKQKKAVMQAVSASTVNLPPQVRSAILADYQKKLGG